MSKSFDDGAALLRIAEKHKLEVEARGALPIGPVPRLAQAQDGDLARGEPGAVVVDRGEMTTVNCFVRPSSNPINHARDCLVSPS
jgi:hypothetical protein